MRRGIVRITSRPARHPFQSRFSSRFSTSSSSTFFSTPSHAWLALSAAAGCSFLLLDQCQVSADDGSQSWLDTVSDYLPTFFEDEDDLIPPVVLNTYGRVPRTLVVGFAGTTCYPQWTRSGGWLVRKRPGYDQFVVTAFSSHYEMVMWTDGSAHMDEQNVQDLDPQGIFQKRLFRDQESLVGFRMVKDLTKLGRDLKRTIVLHHNPKSTYPPENVLLVSDFEDNIDDKELEAVTDFLADIERYNVADVRPAIRRFNENPGADIFKEEREQVAEARGKLAKVIKVDIDQQGGWFSSLKSMFTPKGGKIKPNNNFK